MLLYKAHFSNCSNGKHTTVFYGFICMMLYCTCVKKSVCRFFFSFFLLYAGCFFFSLFFPFSLSFARWCMCGALHNMFFPLLSFQISSNLQTLVWIFLYTKRRNLNENKNHKLCRIVEYPMQYSLYVCECVYVRRMNRVSTK